MENNNKIEIYIKGLMVVHGFITKPSQNSWFLSQKQIDTTTRLKQPPTIPVLNKTKQKES